MDAHGGDAALTSGLGDRLRTEVAAKIEKWQEPPPGKTKKALPKPDEKPRRKRGGRRCVVAVVRSGHMTAAPLP